MATFRPPTREIDRVFLHCSASDVPAHDDVSVMRDWHVNGNGWSDVGYHYFIRKDGTVQEGRSVEKTPAAQQGHNRGTIAICCHGLKVHNFTPAQYASVVELCGQINRVYNGEVTFHGHCEVSSKTCPVYPYKEVLGLDEDGYMSKEPNTSPSGQVEEVPPDLPTLRLMARGESVKILQFALKSRGHSLVVDGIFGRGTLEAIKSFQRAHGLTADGIVGARTWAALDAG